MWTVLPEQTARTMLEETKMGKWESWFDSLPADTQDYLRNQPIWKHNEMVGAVIGAFIVGLLIGLCF